MTFRNRRVAKAIFLITLILLLFVSNHWKMPTFYGPEFLFGGITALAMVLVLGWRSPRDRFLSLEATNRQKDEFLATLSHELRTPLNVIVGHIDYINHLFPDLNPKLRTSFDAIQRNAKLQNQLVSDLLDVSSIITGKMEFDPVLTSLEEIVRSAVESASFSAKAKGISLELECHERLATIMGDPARLRQVVWNLLSNAIKFTPKGGHIVVVLFSDGTNFLLKIRDDGLGIEPKFLTHLFDPFAQEDNSATRSFGGLGVGLSIVRHLVEMHDGKISVFSRGKGHGTTFTMSFPIAQASSKDLPIVELALPELAPNFVDLKVLIVDDDPDSRDLMEMLLQKTGAKVVVASTAAEALFSCTHELYDLIISDIGMPGEDGYTFIKKLRKSDQAKSRFQPAIALTAYIRETDRIKALDAGFQVHLSKPVNFQQLNAQILNLTSSSSIAVTVN